MTEPKDAQAGRSCPWCGAAATADATTCPACGAAMAEREAIGDLVIPGVTSVDPALEAYDAQPWRIPRASPTQGMAGGTIAAAAIGGPAGLAALAGLAAIGAVEYLAAKRGADGETPALEDVGRPGESTLKMLEQLQAEEAAKRHEDPPP